MAVKEKKKAGRPRIKIDYALLEKLATIQCTDSEIAAVLGISRDTVDDRKKNDPIFSDTLIKGKETGKMSLRRKQFDIAQSGNVVMNIWLGKQYLEQTDKQAVEHSGSIGTWNELEREMATKFKEDKAGNSRTDKKATP